MNNKILKIHKIDERYVLSERKFLYTFGYLCLEDELIKNKSMSKKQLYYFLEQRLDPASELEVTLENVVTGKIILVGRGNKFRAYHRPILESKKDNVSENVSVRRVGIKRIEKYSKYTNPLTNLSLSELLEKYNNWDELKENLLYLEEILLRVNEYNDIIDDFSDKNKVKVKSYKKKMATNIDK